MRETDYAYAVSRIRAQELKLLTRQDLEQLLACQTAEECTRLLADKGWDGDREDMLAAELEKAWALIRELAPDPAAFDVFLIKNDYQNLKAAIKAVVTDTGAERLMVSAGRVETGLMLHAAQTGEFERLPEAMREPAATARELLLHTGDGQLADVVLDRAALEEILRAGRQSGNEFFAAYAELTVATTDIKIAVRAQRAGKPADFYERALAPCASVDVKALAAAALEGREALWELIGRTPYAGCVEALTQSLAAFEKWCDDQVMERILSAKTKPFGPEPLAGYLLARETEIRAVRILLSAKHNGLPAETVRERLREMYV